MVEVMKIMAMNATLSAPKLQQATAHPTPPPETPGHSRASLGQSLVGSLPLSPGSGAQGSVCAHPESVSTSCGSSSGSVVG